MTSEEIIQQYLEEKPRFIIWELHKEVLESKKDKLFVIAQQGNPTSFYPYRESEGSYTRTGTMNLAEMEKIDDWTLAPFPMAKRIITEEVIRNLSEQAHLIGGGVNVKFHSSCCVDKLVMLKALADCEDAPFLYAGGDYSTGDVQMGHDDFPEDARKMLYAYTALSEEKREALLTLTKALR